MKGIARQCLSLFVYIRCTVLFLNLNNLGFLDFYRQHLALDVYLCHLGLGIAVHSDACPELARSAFLSVEDYNDRILSTRLDGVGGVLLAGAAATCEDLVYIQVGITGVSEDKGAFAYWGIVPEFSQVNCRLLEFNLGALGIICLCCKREQCA